MEAEITYLLEEQARKLENAEMLIERLKREVMALSFSVELHDRAAEKAIALWAEAHPDKAEEWLRREDLMVWMIEGVERAEAVKESLTSALKEICVHTAHWKTVENGMGRAFAWVWQTASTALRTAEDSSVVDSTLAKQPEGMTKLDKALQKITTAKRILIENSCPSEFGLKDCECDDSCCEDCWNEEVTE